jgi:hypothetical protein
MTLRNQTIYYPGTGSTGPGTVCDVRWNDKEAWGTVGNVHNGPGRPVTGTNVQLDADGIITSASWSVVEERRGP